MKAKHENLLLFSTIPTQGRDEEEFKSTEQLQIALQSLRAFLRESHPFWERIQFGTFRVHRSGTPSVMYGWNLFSRRTKYFQTGDSRLLLRTDNIHHIEAC